MLPHPSSSLTLPLRHPIHRQRNFLLNRLCAALLALLMAVGWLPPQVAVSAPSVTPPDHKQRNAPPTLPSPSQPINGPATFAITATVGATVYATGNEPAPTYAPGYVIVKFKPALVEQLRQQAAADPAGGVIAAAALPTTLAPLAATVGLLRMEPLFPRDVLARATGRNRDAQLQARLAQREIMIADTLSRLDAIYRVQVAGDVQQAVDLLAADPQVEYAQPDYSRRVTVIPNDPFFTTTDLWGLYKVNAPTAWDTATGAGVVVAVIDSGVVITHPDLQANIYIDPNEIAGNGLDDDSNGYIDDTTGWDFFENDNRPNDAHGHGTHVAGTIAAVGNNQRGVVGLAYNSKIMPLRGLGPDGSGWDSGLSQAIVYAALNGADVINNSWGGPGRSALTTDAINLAHSLGVIVVSAAGNDNQESCTFSPANVEKGITVAATDLNDNKTYYSNYGVKIDVAAPGGSGQAASNGILSTVPPTSYLETILGVPTQLGPSGEKYMAISGTSMASPHVAALAALLLQRNPTWNNEEIRQAIRTTAVDLGATGFDAISGFGRINAAAALALTARPLMALVNEPYNCSQLSGIVEIKGTAAGVGFASYALQIGSGATPSSFQTLFSSTTPVTDGLLGLWNSADLPDGVHVLRLVVTKSNGQSYEDRNQITTKNTIITAPAANTIINTNQQSQVTIYGQAPTGSNGGTQLLNYKLEAAPGYQPVTGPFVQINSRTTPVFPAGVLGVWNLANVADGAYTLRLTTTYNTHTVVDEIQVVVDRYLRPGWPINAWGGYRWSFKSPIVVDLDRNGANEIVLGKTVFQIDGTPRPGWDSNPGYGSANSAVVDLNQDGDYEIIAGAGDQWQPTGPAVEAYDHQRTLLWRFEVPNPDLAAPGNNAGTLSTTAIGDVDGSPGLEAVFKAWFYYRDDPADRDTTLFILDAATGALKRQMQLPGVSWAAVALANLDGQPGDEIIFPAYSENAAEEAYLYAIKGNGTHAAGWPRTFIDRATAHVTFAGWSVFQEAVVADVDRNGDPEVLLGRYLWNHDGTFFNGWPVDYQARNTGAFGQFDGDTALEVVAGGVWENLFHTFQHTGAPGVTVQMGGHTRFVGMFGEDGNQGAPLVADLNGDGQADLVTSHELGFPHGLHPLFGSHGNSGVALPYFPRYVVDHDSDSLIRTMPVVDDLDCDGRTDLLLYMRDQFYAWELPTVFRRGANHWPMFQHDARRTGNYETNLGSIHACLRAAAPSNLVATATGSTVVNLAWLDNADNETGFVVQACQGAGCTNFAQLATLPANTNTYQATSLAAGTAHRYRVRAFNNRGNSTFSTIANVVTLVAPANLNAMAVTRTRIDLTWQDLSTQELGHLIERCQGVNCTNFAQIASIGRNTTLYRNTGLQVNTPYCYRVRSRATRSFSDYSPVVCRSTLGAATNSVQPAAVDADLSLQLEGDVTYDVTATPRRLTVVEQAAVTVQIPLRCADGNKPTTATFQLGETGYPLTLADEESALYAATFPIAAPLVIGQSYPATLRYGCADDGQIHAIALGEWELVAPTLEVPGANNEDENEGESEEESSTVPAQGQRAYLPLIQR
jgi:subtilisin family serine protease